jgi:hypothetical protein
MIIDEYLLIPARFSIHDDGFVVLNYAYLPACMPRMLRFLAVIIHNGLLHSSSCRFPFLRASWNRAGYELDPLHLGRYL